MSLDIEAKELLIETQRNTLTSLETKCTEAKNESEQKIAQEVEQFMKRRREETTKLNDEIRKVVDATRGEYQSCSLSNPKFR